MVVCCLPEDLSGADLAVRVARRSSGRVVLVVLVVLVLWPAVRSSGFPPGRWAGAVCLGVWLDVAQIRQGVYQRAFSDSERTLGLDNNDMDGYVCVLWESHL